MHAGYYDLASFVAISVSELHYVIPNSRITE